MNQTKNIALFSTIKLEEMGKVNLMNRYDQKYWFHKSHLAELLNVIKDDYYVLTIDNESLLGYSTIYYDTSENEMFVKHHNGNLNRYKIRRRTYLSSGLSFLEIKFKSNKGRTIKNRIVSEQSKVDFDSHEEEFIQKNSPYLTDNLQVSLKNEFFRITLVNKNFKERCTIDLNLNYFNEEKTQALDDLVVVEIKTNGKSGFSPLARALRSIRIKKTGFSKYCIGRTITDDKLKRNAFKAKIRFLNKTLNINYSLYKAV